MTELDRQQVPTERHGRPAGSLRPPDRYASDRARQPSTAPRRTQGPRLLKMWMGARCGCKFSPALNRLRLTFGQAGIRKPEPEFPDRPDSPGRLTPAGQSASGVCKGTPIPSRPAWLSAIKRLLTRSQWRMCATFSQLSDEPRLARPIMTTRWLEARKHP